MLHRFHKFDHDRVINKYLKNREVACKCRHRNCVTTLLDHRVNGAFYKLRHILGLPLHVTSGYRCELHNQDVGGSLNSYHTQGKALDIVFNPKLKGSVGYNYTLNYFIDCAKEAGFTFYKHYPEKNFIHLDIREV